MAFRGCGRGRGRGSGGGYSAYVKPEPYVLFPGNVQLPDVNEVVEEKALVLWNMRLQNFWRSSPYYLEEADTTTESSKSKDTDIERYSDRGKPSQAKRDPLSYHLKLTAPNFPQELIHGSRHVHHDQRKVRWNPEPGLQRLDKLERLEEKHGDKAESEKEKKEGDDEDEEEGEDIDSEEDEMSDDYNQNVDLDDDEDDYNMDEGEDEATY
ncbi:Dna-directed rna polymerase iii subunit [Thalictrum thalictroides]|uniref:Dna-directed rna polymerase iii subunit n=1 Tax=Thalictrum thalictroides TaxID=46969 RepID=A0A7J6VZH3_THATH|nr:Dna-directed rna polymerase iii subunit [Thalictrum thalictroides]